MGSYDRRLCWFDLDLSSKPYRTLRYLLLSLSLCVCVCVVLRCADSLTIQIPPRIDTLRGIPSALSALRVVFGRRHGADIPRNGLQRLDAESSDRASEDTARTRDH
jgi:hypothetical protein